MAPRANAPVAVVAVLLALLGCLLAGCAVGEGRAAPATAPTAAPTPTAGPAPTAGPTTAPRALFLGDSYTVGLGGAGYVRRTADAMGWTPLVDAESGTGYLDPSTTPGQTRYADRLASVQRTAPDIVVVQGSTNDVDEPPQAVEAAAGELYRLLAEALPGARIVVLGPLSPPAVDPVAVAAIRDGLARAAAAAGLPFIDPIAGGWLVPPDGRFADGLHPSDAGYADLADQLVAALRGLGF